MLRGGRARTARSRLCPRARGTAGLPALHGDLAASGGTPGAGDLPRALGGSPWAVPRVPRGRAELSGAGRARAEPGPAGGARGCGRGPFKALPARGGWALAGAVAAAGPHHVGGRTALSFGGPMVIRAGEMPPAAVPAAQGAEQQQPAPRDSRPAETQQRPGKEPGRGLRRQRGPGCGAGDARAEDARSSGANPPLPLRRRGS